MPQKNLRVEFDNTTAMQVAEFFEASGMLGQAARMWVQLSVLAPYDLALRHKAADLFYDIYLSNRPADLSARSRFLLESLSQSYPTRRLSAAYFENLEQILKSRSRRAQPGRIVLVAGTGRSGSTTVAAALAGRDDVCATHENPPTIYWEPLEGQVAFHLKRLRILADYYELVTDAAHWWLNVSRRFFIEFPEGRMLGVVRDTQACVQSFLNIKGAGADTINHWAMPGNGIWPANLWDPTYPSYPVSDTLQTQPEMAKAALIERYVNDYNRALAVLAGSFPDRVALVRTEKLSLPDTAAQLSQVFGVSVPVLGARLNVGHTRDSDSRRYMF